MLVVVPDRYDFDFDTTHLQEITIIGNRKLPELFESYLGNLNNKTNLMKYLFQNWRNTLTNVLTSSQTIDLTGLEVATDRVTSQCSKKNFYCNHEEADTKMFAYIKFPCDDICLKRVIIVSSDTDVAVISSYRSVASLTFLNAIRSKTGTGNDQRYIPIQV